MKPLFFSVLVLSLLSSVEGSLILGTGSGALVGSDLTDIGDDGVEGAYSPPNLGGFDAEFFASQDAAFGGGEFSFNVFDGDVGGGNAKVCCTSPNMTIGANFQNIYPGSTIELTSFTLTSSNDTPARDPVKWTIQGSNNTTTGFDGAWTTIYDHSSASSSDWTERNQVIRYSPADGDTFLTTDRFTAFRMVTTQTGTSVFALNEIEFFGVVVPEPSTTLLLGTMLSLGGFMRRRRKLS